MDRFLRYAAYLAALAQLLAIGFLLTQAYGRDVGFFLLFALPPLLTIAALYCGPDIEERRLTRKLAKARLRKALQDLE